MGKDQGLFYYFTAAESHFSRFLGDLQKLTVNVLARNSELAGNPKTDLQLSVVQLYRSVRRETVTSHTNRRESMMGAESVPLSLG
jgi:hypothetical protein